jgi:integrase
MQTRQDVLSGADGARTRDLRRDRPALSPTRLTPPRPIWPDLARNSGSAGPTAWQMPLCATRTEEIAQLAIRDALTRRRRPSTLENKRHIWEQRVMPAFGGRVAAEVSHDEAQAVATSWAAQHGPHAATKAAKEAGHGWRLAMRRGWILRSPWDGVDVGARRGEQRVMPPDARRRMVRYLEPIGLLGQPGPYRRNTALVLLWLAEVPTGRMAEAAELPWSGVDLARGIVTWRRHKRDQMGPKHAILSPYALTVLDAARELGGREHVFGDPPPHDLTKSMARVCQRLGLDRYTPHDLRRGIAQEAIDAGAQLEDVQAMLGHESRSTTEAYVRWSSHRARRAHSLVALEGGRR